VRVVCVCVEVLLACRELCEVVVIALRVVDMVDWVDVRCVVMMVRFFVGCVLAVVGECEEVFVLF